MSFSEETQLPIESYPVPGFMPVHPVIYQEQQLVITLAKVASRSMK